MNDDCEDLVVLIFPWRRGMKSNIRKVRSSGAISWKPPTFFQRRKARHPARSAASRMISDPIRHLAPYPLYALALAVSISTWFIAIRAPLWLDETVSFFVIKKGFSEILSRQGWPGVPAYPYILWLWSKAVGTGEVMLKNFFCSSHAGSGLSAVPFGTGTVRLGCCGYRCCGLLPSSDYQLRVY